MGGDVKFDKWLNDGGSENFKCRAWVNFNGIGTVAIRASGNVSSITDNGTGDYTVNFIDAMPDADYSCNVTMNANNIGDSSITDGSILVQSIGSTRVISHLVTAGTGFDPYSVNVSIHR